jgi:ABC-2 type transport system permease protein
VPIHDQGYRRYAGQRIPPGRAWWVIARAGVLERVRERRFLALLLLAWSPFIVRALQIYASTSFAQLSFLAPGPETFREFLDQQSPFLFFVTLYAGSGLIASDRRANALQVYFSKPLTRLQYVAGKLAVLAIFLLGASWLPAMTLLALQVIFAGSPGFIGDNPWLVPAMTLFCVVEVLATSLAMLALSSLSKNRRFVAVMYAGAIVFAAAMYQVLRRTTGSDAWAWLSPEEVFDALAIAIFRATEEPALSAPVALMAIGAIVAASIFILDRRVRAVDVVT